MANRLVKRLTAIPLHLVRVLAPGVVHEDRLVVRSRLPRTLRTGSPVFDSDDPERERVRETGESAIS